MTASAPASRLVGLACLLVTSIGWGINWSVMKFLLTQWPPLFMRGSSGLLAAVGIALIAVARRERVLVPAPLVPGLIVRALLNVFAWMGFSSLALRWLSAGQGAMLVYTMPVWAMLLAWPLLGKRPHAGGLAAVALCGIGIGVLFGPQSASLGLAQWPGVAFALLAAVLFAFGTVRLRPLPLPPFAQLAWQLAIGCMPMVAYGGLLEHPQWHALTTRGLAAFAYMTVFAMGVCYLTWFAAVRRLSVATASMGTLMTPVIGVVSGALFLGEPLGATQWAALLLIVCGVALALRERA